MWAGCSPFELSGEMKSGGWLTTCTPTRVAGSHRFRDEPGALARLAIHVLPAGIAPASARLEGGCLRLLGHGSGGKNWSRASVLPRVPPRSEQGGFADSLARGHEIVS